MKACFATLVILALSGSASGENQEEPKSCMKQGYTTFDLIKKPCCPGLRPRKMGNGSGKPFYWCIIDTSNE